jgi:tetrapyrrole methylase family protein/MazG family protein
MAKSSKAIGIERLTELMERLRGPDGCPWDREQKLESLTPFIIEEAYEVVDAIESGDAGSVKDELGDLLFQIIFACRIMTEDGSFGLAEVIENTVEKMIRRHPHVYGDTQAETAAEVLKNWDEIKSRERTAADGEARKSALSGIPNSMPSLLRAAKISKRAAKTGFDWKDLEHVMEKLTEELGEFREALHSGEAGDTEEELGDILFTLVNVARFAEVNPEMALKKAIDKFTRRFNRVERSIEEEGGELGSATAEELERLWNEAKLREKNP